MKKKISVNVEEKNLFKIREAIRVYRHGNKSQAVEFFLKQFLEDLKNEGKTKHISRR